MKNEDVRAAVRNELNKEDEFTQIQRTPEEQLTHVREEVTSLSKYLEQKKIINKAKKYIALFLAHRSDEIFFASYPVPVAKRKYFFISPCNIWNAVTLVTMVKYGRIYHLMKWSYTTIYANSSSWTIGTGQNLWGTRAGAIDKGGGRRLFFDKCFPKPDLGTR